MLNVSIFTFLPCEENYFYFTFSVEPPSNSSYEPPSCSTIVSLGTFNWFLRFSLSYTLFLGVEEGYISVSLRDIFYAFCNIFFYFKAMLVPPESPS
jgi:hypothetical protein